MKTSKPRQPCYDCGSTIKGQHTKLCGLAPDNAKRNLPAYPGTQYWTGSMPVEQYEGLRRKDKQIRANIRAGL